MTRALSVAAIQTSYGEDMAATFSVRVMPAPAG